MTHPSVRLESASAPVPFRDENARALRSMGVSKRSRASSDLLVVMMLLGLARRSGAGVRGFQVVSDGTWTTGRPPMRSWSRDAQYNNKPSPVPGARLDHARVLYRRGVAPHRDRGGKQPGPVQARAGQDYLARRGVPAVTWRRPWATTPASRLLLLEMADRRVGAMSPCVRSRFMVPG